MSLDVHVSVSVNFLVFQPTMVSLPNRKPEAGWLGAEMHRCKNGKSPEASFPKVAFVLQPDFRTAWAMLSCTLNLLAP